MGRLVIDVAVKIGIIKWIDLAKTGKTSDRTSSSQAEDETRPE